MLELEDFIREINAHLESGETDKIESLYGEDEEEMVNG